MKGAESIVRVSKFLGKKIVVKERIPKTYRTKELDMNLRKTRTKIEARLLNKAKKAGVVCPTVWCVEEYTLYLSFIKGKRPVMNEKNAQKAGIILAQLHHADIIHGDYTPANLILDTEMVVIDFGLGFFSTDVEDKAIDVLTMRNAIATEEGKKAFLKGYSSYQNAPSILKRIKQVESRVRYF